MAKVYIITEEEMGSLFHQLKLESMTDSNTVFRKDHDKPANMKDAHRAFNFIVTRWSQSVGFGSVR